MMMLATTRVEAVDRWLKIFTTTSAVKRKQHGSKGSRSSATPPKRIASVRSRGRGDPEGGRSQAEAGGRAVPAAV
jgi:hypothetical protein